MVNRTPFFPFIICCWIGVCFVLRHNSLFEILSGHLTFKKLNGRLFVDTWSEYSTGSVYWFNHSFSVYSWFMQPNFQLTWLCTVEWWGDKWVTNSCPDSDRVNVPAYDGLEEMDRSTKTLSHGGRFVGLETSWILVRTQASPYGTCDRKKALGQAFLRVLWFSPVSIITPTLHNHLPISHRGCTYILSNW